MYNPKYSVLHLRSLFRSNLLPFFTGSHKTSVQKNRRKYFRIGANQGVATILEWREYQSTASNLRQCFITTMSLGKTSFQSILKSELKAFFIPSLQESFGFRFTKLYPLACKYFQYVRCN